MLKNTTIYFNYNINVTTFFRGPLSPSRLFCDVRRLTCGAVIKWYITFFNSYLFGYLCDFFLRWFLFFFFFMTKILLFNMCWKVTVFRNIFIRMNMLYILFRFLHGISAWRYIRRKLFTKFVICRKSKTLTVLYT